MTLGFLIVALVGAFVGEVLRSPGLGLLLVAGAAVVWLQRLQARIDRLEAQRREQVPAAAPAVPSPAVPAPAVPAPAVPAAAVQVPPATPAAAESPLPRADRGPDTVPLGVAPAAAPQAVMREVDETSTRITSSIGQSVLAWFRGGNTIVRAGVVILFIGVAFLLRFAAEHALLPIEFRLALVAVGGVALCIIGWRLRERRAGYALSLQGGGIGVLYLVIFAALRLYALLPAPLAFALLVALALATALLAMLQHALPLAVLAFSGGFLAPVLTSTGEGSHVALFSYYLVLNLAIAWIASRRAWKLLNLVGFGFTFVIGTAWGLRSYEPSLFATTELFLVLHFALYLFVSVQYSRQLVAAQDEARLRYVDGGLLFGLPIVAFGLQAGVVRHLPYGLALSSAALSGIYLLLGRWLWRRAGARLRLLTEGLLALGLIFLVLVTPLALDARWTGAAWAVQGAGIVWIALRQQRAWAAAFGLLLQLIAAVSFWSQPREPVLPLVLNAHLLGALLLGAAAFASAHLLKRHAGDGPLRPAQAAPLQALMLAAAVVQTLAGLWLEWRLVDAPSLDAGWRASLLLVAMSLALAWNAGRWRWPELVVPARLLVAAAVVISAGHLPDFSAERVFARFFVRWGWVEMLAVLGAAVWLQRRLSGERPLQSSTGAEHLLFGWYLLLQAGVQPYALAAHAIARHEAWTPTAAIVLPTLVAWALARACAGGRWPVAEHPAWWRRGLLLPWGVLLVLWALIVDLAADGAMDPLPYLPLVNPIDLGHALAALYALTLWRTGVVSARPLAVVLAGTGFVWLDAMLVRTLHHWADTPMWLDGALHASLVQTGLTILWTTLALLAMLYATRRAPPDLARRVWIAGAALLAVVVAKLFFVDLSSIGTLERIVSFLGVGLLMLVIGYVSPMPPAARAAT
jgi:uncharacterized membrane protein